MAQKDEVGKTGEQLAIKTLQDEGYRVLDRNWRGRSGELDAIALDGDTLVCVEVKTRSSLRFGHPAAAVTDKKIAALRRLTGQWLSENRGRPELRNARGLREVRVDVISVLLGRDLPPQVELRKAAI
jgi:putative endonuclease